MTETTNSAAIPVIETKDAIIASDRQVGVRRINQYQVFERIGRGMHGSDRRGRDNATGEFVVRSPSIPYPKSHTKKPFFDALFSFPYDLSSTGAKAIKAVDRVQKHNKILPNALRNASRAMLSTTEKAVRREIAIMKKCNHKNVVRLKEVIDDRLKKRIYLGTPRCCPPFSTPRSIIISHHSLLHMVRH